MKIKRFAKITALLLAAAIAIASLVACFDFGASFGGGETCTVVVAGTETTEYPVDLSKVEIREGVFSLLDYLQKEGKLEYDASESTFGKFLNAVGSVQPNAANSEYVQVYTSVEADFDTSAYFTEITYRGTRLGSSGLGASSMTVEANAIYYFTLGSY